MREITWLMLMAVPASWDANAVSGGEKMADFKVIGPCVNAAQPYQAVVTRDRATGREMVYRTYGVTSGGSFFLLAIDPRTGETEQYAPDTDPPVGHGYVSGTSEGDLVVTTVNGRVYHFDTGTREFELLAQDLPWIWEPDLAPDGWLYAATYKPGAPGMIRVHPREKKVEDLGVMGPPEDDNAYAGRRLAFDRQGIVYCPMGLRITRLVAYDPSTQTQTLLTPPEGAWEGSFSLIQGGDGQVYVRYRGRLFAAHGETLEEIPADTAIPSSALRLADGTILRFQGDQALVLTDPSGDQEKTVSYEYRSAAGLGVTLEVLDGKVHGFSNYPNRAYSYDPATGKIQNYGNVPSGTTYCMVPYRGKFWIAGYAMPMAVWDLNRPWNWGTDPDRNPRSVGRVTTLASAAVFSPTRHRIYIAWAAGYGPAGGHIVELDPDTGEWEDFQPYEHQGIVSLALHVPTGLLVGGTHKGPAAPGCIPSPEEKHCFLFLWDPIAHQKVYEATPFPEAESISALAATPEGQVVGVCQDQLFRFDVENREVIVGPPLPAGAHSLRVGPGGRVYAVCSNGEFLAIDPRTGSVESLATFPQGRPSAMVPLGDALYFTFGSELGVLRF